MPIKPDLSQGQLKALKLVAGLEARHGHAWPSEVCSVDGVTPRTIRGLAARALVESRDARHAARAARESPLGLTDRGRRVVRCIGYHRRPDGRFELVFRGSML